jgi:hypothetical protein
MHKAAAMHRTAAIALSTAALAVLALNGGQAVAGGSVGTRPIPVPLPTDPGTVVSRSSTTAVVRSTDTVLVMQNKLDDLYVTRRGCTLRLAVNKPRDYLCHNRATGKTDEIVFTFAALDPTASDPSRSQSNAYYFPG